MGRLPFLKQIVCITGTNAQAPEARQEMSSPHSLHGTGKVSNMDEWMRAADVVVEIQALGRPMVIHRSVSGLASGGRVSARQQINWRQQFNNKNFHSVHNIRKILVFYRLRSEGTSPILNSPEGREGD